MADRVPPEKRSEIMRAVRGAHTRPELIVRSAAHRLGLRFRLHDKSLPGRPDLVLRRWKTVIFVNGCYWHRHASCKKATMPKSNVDFWHGKFERNIARDQSNHSDLAKMGWRVVVLWQCEIGSIEKAMALLSHYFVSPKSPRKRGTR